MTRNRFRVIALLQRAQIRLAVVNSMHVMFVHIFTQL
ncbi:unnamed protein product [Gongylonema pulchrum]|uniref:Uncharacterized protein n=1 Tax=Gongylonema pulchrum TaxID=637853 RepID=A0A3P7N6D4_9BILA|nr:unnamed protein product [Gongylonema pulchrum]